MRIRTLAVCVAIIAAAAFGPKLATAAALPGASKANVETTSMVEQVRRGGHRGHRHRGHRHHFHHHHHRRHFGHHHRRHFGHHHRRHRHFHRHFRHRHFYGGGYYYGGRCVHVRHRCADRWGWGTRAFYRCVYNRGC